MPCFYLLKKIILEDQHGNIISQHTEKYYPTLSYEEQQILEAILSAKKIYGKASPANLNKITREFHILCYPHWDHKDCGYWCSCEIADAIESLKNKGWVTYNKNKNEYEINLFVEGD